MKRRRWKVRTHFCARIETVKRAYGAKPDLKVCSDCGRIQNWQVIPRIAGWESGEKK